ncbi:uncharacterized protein METZ01_LOCUS393582 [marine metagenome]|uniref:Uncharacterized protein n=1 Tax=marine metagenome TaxID=408172 RepID=A0A382V471_9ZZZZ
MHNSNLAQPGGSGNWAFEGTRVLIIIKKHLKMHHTQTTFCSVLESSLVHWYSVGGRLAPDGLLANPVRSERKQP